MDPVIADQNGFRDLAGAAGDNEIEGEARFARARGAANQDRALADANRRGMNSCGNRTCHGAGSRTTKCAPIIVGTPSASAGPTRFSAQMRPPWASMICLEIDRPSPEFCPKP